MNLDHHTVFYVSGGVGNDTAFQIWILIGT